MANTKDVNLISIEEFSRAIRVLRSYIEELQIGHGDSAFTKYKVLLAIIIKRTGLEPRKLRLELGLRGVTTQRVFDHLIDNKVLKQDEDDTYEIITWFQKYFSPQG